MVTAFKKNKFTQTLATGAATVAVIAGVGVVLTPSQASAITLAEFCPASGTGLTITVGDKLFSNCNLVGTPTNVDPANIDVNGIDAGTLDPGPGLSYTFRNDELSLIGPGTKQIFFKYQVDIDPITYPAWIKDNTLQFTANVTGSNSSAEVHEFVYEDKDMKIPALGVDPDPPGVGTITHEKDVIRSIDVSNNENITIPKDSINFNKLYKTLYIFNEFSVDVSGPTGTASISNVKQNFSQTVPEPSSVLGLLALGGLGLGLKRKKQG